MIKQRVRGRPRGGGGGTRRDSSSSSSPSEAMIVTRRGATTTTRSKVVVAAALEQDIGDDEIVVVRKHARMALRVPFVTPPAAAATPSSEYSAERITQMKREMQQPPPVVAAAAVISGPAAIELAQAKEEEDEEDESSEVSDSSSSYSSSTSSSMPSGEHANDPQPIATTTIHHYDTPISILAELTSFGDALRKRQSELNKDDIADVESSSEVNVLATKQVELDAIKKTRSGISDMLLYMRGLRACLGGLMPLIAQIENEFSPTALLAILQSEDAKLQQCSAIQLPKRPLFHTTTGKASLFEFVHDDFASATAIVKRFAQWRQHDTSSYETSNARAWLPELLAPYVRYALVTKQPGVFPSERPSEWPGMPAVEDDIVADIAAITAGTGLLSHTLKHWNARDSLGVVNEVVALAASSSNSRSLIGAALASALQTCYNTMMLPWVTDFNSLDGSTEDLVKKRYLDALAWIQGVRVGRDLIGHARACDLELAMTSDETFELLRKRFDDKG